jgi:exonuclease III
MAVWSRPAAARRLGLVSLNVNGLSSAAKRHALFLRLGVLSHDIVVLQETHCGGDDSAAAWLKAGAGAGRPWMGRAFWSHGQKSSRGVAILFKNSFAATEVAVEYSDSAAPHAADATGGPSADGGRVLRVGWPDAHTGERWSVVAVYAPNRDADQEQFFFF